MIVTVATGSVDVQRGDSRDQYKTNFSPLSGRSLAVSSVLVYSSFPQREKNLSALPNFLCWQSVLILPTVVGASCYKVTLPRVGGMRVVPEILNTQFHAGLFSCFQRSQVIYYNPHTSENSLEDPRGSDTPKATSPLRDIRCRSHKTVNRQWHGQSRTIHASRRLFELKVPCSKSKAEDHRNHIPLRIFLESMCKDFAHSDSVGRIQWAVGRFGMP